MPHVAFWCILVYFGVFLTFWCILVHSAAFWFILVHFGAFWCISVPVHLDVFFGALGARFRAWRRGGPPGLYFAATPVRKSGNHTLALRFLSSPAANHTLALRFPSSSFQEPKPSIPEFFAHGAFQEPKPLISWFLGAKIAALVWWSRWPNANHTLALRSRSHAWNQKSQHQAAISVFWCRGRR